MPASAHTAAAVNAQSQPADVSIKPHPAPTVAATVSTANSAATAGHRPSGVWAVRASIQGCDRRQAPRPEPSGLKMRLEEAQDAAPGVLRGGLVVADAGHPQDRPGRPQVVPVEERVARVRVLADVALDAGAREARVQRRRGPAQGLVLARRSWPRPGRRPPARRRGPPAGGRSWALRRRTRGSRSAARSRRPGRSRSRRSCPCSPPGPPATRGRSRCRRTPSRARHRSARNVARRQRTAPPAEYRSGASAR